MSINPSSFYNELKINKISFFTGVPDSLLKDFCLCLDNQANVNNHIITANEGNAIALASGYHLATNEIPLVYMQNSGLGNAINPLLSLCDVDVYSVPLVLMIGWRGEPGFNDEPQHIKQGKIQLELLETLNLPYEIISKNDKEYAEKIAKVIKISKSEKRPVALLIKKKTFSKYKFENNDAKSNLMLREEALNIILKKLNREEIIVSTTGKTSREIFEIRKRCKQGHDQDFLTVGSMGHCSSIALGIALSKPNRKVFCIDGDGSMLMHFGSLTSVVSLAPINFYHILLNNEVHESVGGQATAAKSLNISKFIKEMGYKNVFKVNSLSGLKNKFKIFMKGDGPSFLEIKIKPGSRSDLGRPTIKPNENKLAFMENLK
jgi:phosphonopyruvate decarboxylase